MKIVGLTGSIAMGKSTVSVFFKQAGIPVFSADEAVHELYKCNSVIPRIEKAFPSVVQDNQVNRLKLSEICINDCEKLKILEEIIHPLVRIKEKEFINMAREKGEKLIILDIPLFFETKSEDRVDSVIVVSATSDIQKKRAMLRQNMDEKKFAIINSKQMSDEQKRERADFVIDTGKNLEDTRKQVLDVITSLLKDSS